MFAVIIARSEQRFRQLDRSSVLAEFSSTCIGGSDPVLISVIAGVENIKVIIFRNCGTGMASLIVIECIRMHADTFILPVYKILGGYMIPVFQPVYRAPGAPLIEQVPCSVILCESVRITGKTCYRLNMIFLSVV